MSKAVRQGDVLVWPSQSIPASASEVPPEEDRLIVARGEATGHHHSFPHRRGAVLFRDGTVGPLYVKVDALVALEHQEHAALRLAPGIYEIQIQRTFVSGMVRQVAD